MSNPADFRKVIGGLVLSVLWVCTFLFIKPSLVIDWAGDGSIMTPLMPVIALIGLLVIVFYHIFYHSSSEANKLSWTVVLTVSWLAMIIFYPFKDPANQNGGAVAFFALLGGLAVVVLWVRFFSDEIITA
ncbi:MAG TPA: hypothetical protein VL485_18765 [Ktedonobacteraceae bacterium]|nr:hypothetical protein [Ktedonobacteraceae bacterium]